MADPFTYASGIAGLISLGLEVTKITRSYIRSFRKAKKDAEEMLLELRALSDVLCRLAEFLKHSKSWESEFDRTSALFLSHIACGNKMRRMRAKLLRGRNSRFFKSTVWPFEKEDHQANITALHRWVQTFHFALTIDGW